MLNVIFCILIILNCDGYKISTKPSSVKYKNNLPLFWKLLKKKDISNRPQKIIFDNFPINVYKDYNGEIVATSDICVHRGASLSEGKLLVSNCIQCPYHGWEFKDGLVENIPGCPDTKKELFGVPKFETKIVNDDLYLCPTYDINSEKGNKYNHTIFIPPEATDSNFVRISGNRRLKRPNNLITENVLDMMHISYVHSFGNSLAPIPFKIDYKDLGELSGRTTFHYNAGPNSMSKIIGGAKYVKVENEFHLPDVTVTRVHANNIVKTIVTHCYPISKNESILHYDLYRNFFTSPLINPLFEYQMRVTLDEDVYILNQIYDDYIRGFMSNKFDVTQTKYREKIKKLKNKFDISDK